MTGDEDSDLNGLAEGAVAEAREDAERWAARVKELEARIARAREALEPLPPRPEPVAFDHVMPTPADVHALAREKGWWPELDRGDETLSDASIDAKIALIHSELSEATEAIREGKLALYYVADKYGQPKPEGAVVELADAVIRAWDLAGGAGVGSAPVSGEAHLVGQCELSADEMLALIAALHARAVNLHTLKTNSVLGGDMLDTFAFAVITQALVLKLDIFTAIKVKHHYNRTRAHRHGGKLA